MAQVGQDAKAKVDWLLDYLIETWVAVPDAVLSWQSWDVIEKEDFQLEWTIPTENLNELRAHAASGDLTPAQTRRYEELLSLIEWHRPALDDLLADEAA